MSECNVMNSKISGLNNVGCLGLQVRQDNTFLSVMQPYQRSFANGFNHTDYLLSMIIDSYALICNSYVCCFAMQAHHFMD